MSDRHIPKTRRHVWINDDDWDFLCRAYGSGSTSQTGASQMVRKIVEVFVSRLREAANQSMSSGAPDGRK